MESITHAPGNDASTRNTHRTFTHRQPVAQGAHGTPTKPLELSQELVGQFYAEAKRQIVTGDYLRRKWQPLVGPKFCALIRTIRGFCSYEIKEGEAMCYPSEPTLAQACGVSRRTLLYWFQRSPEGRFARKVKLPDGGEQWEEWTWSALQAFLRIAPKRRYDPVGQRSLKASNRYYVRMDDPPVPEDEPLIWARAYELAEHYLTHQAEEQERQARREDAESRATQNASFRAADCTLNNVQKLHAQQCAKIAHNPPSLTASYYPDGHRTILERLSSDDIAIGSVPPPATTKKTLVGDKAAFVPRNQQTRSEAGQEPRRAAASSETNRAAQPMSSAFELALLAAEEAAGALLVEVLRQYGDADPVGGMKTILIALVDAGAPVEQLCALAKLGQNRLWRRAQRGGQIRTQQAYFIGVMQRLARQAQERGWNVTAMEAEDQAEHENILRQKAMRRIGHRRAYIEPEAQGAEAAEEAAMPEGAEVRWTEADETVAPPAARGYADADPRAATTSEAETGVRQMVSSAEAQEGAGGTAATNQPPPQEECKEASQHVAPRRDGRARQIWQSTLERIQPHISPAMFNTWFAGTSGRSLCGQVLTVAVRTTFNRSHLETRFHDLVCSILCDLVGPEAEVRFEVKREQE